jgi:hypothetical protein
VSVDSSFESEFEVSCIFIETKEKKRTDQNTLAFYEYFNIGDTMDSNGSVRCTIIVQNRCNLTCIIKYKEIDLSKLR